MSDEANGRSLTPRGEYIADLWAAGELVRQTISDAARSGVDSYALRNLCDTLQTLEQLHAMEDVRGKVTEMAAQNAVGFVASSTPPSPPPVLNVSPNELRPATGNVNLNYRYDRANE